MTLTEQLINFRIYKVISGENVGALYLKEPYGTDIVNMHPLDLSVSRRVEKYKRSTIESTGTFTDSFGNKVPNEQYIAGRFELMLLAANKIN